MSGTEKDSSAIDSEHEENDVTAKQNEVPYNVAPSSSRPSKIVVLSPQLIEKYETRFENGYNIYTDEGYVQWLREVHHDSLSSGKIIINSFVYCITLKLCSLFRCLE